MAHCLNDQQLASFVQGSASAEDISTWKEHLATCDSCAVRLARRQNDLTSDPAKSDAGPSDPDETVMVKPAGKDLRRNNVTVF